MKLEGVLRSFYVFKRSNGTFYVQFVDPISGKLSTARSTGKRDYDGAVKQSYEWLLSASVCKQKETLGQQFLSLAMKKKFGAVEVSEIRAALEYYSFNELGIVVSSVGDCGVLKASGGISRKTLLLEYLKEFWDYEKSDYVQDKVGHGQRIGKQHCYEMGNLVKYWREFFSEQDTVEDLNTLRLQKFESFLRNRKTVKMNKKTGESVTASLSTITISNIIKCAKIALNWAVRKALIAVNPCDGLTAYSVKNKKRDILSQEEAAKLFQYGLWRDGRSRVASLVAMTCGLRIGEILALHENDIGSDVLYVRHSWSSRDKLGTTKNGESRTVPLLPSVRGELVRLALQNPHKNQDSGFIFWGDKPNQPVVQNVITEDFKSALGSIGITEDERRLRNIVFHSWRHYYATEITRRIELAQAQMALGHLTPAMTKHYADHKTVKDLEMVKQAVNEAFANMVQFSVTA